MFRSQVVPFIIALLMVSKEEKQELSFTRVSAQEGKEVASVS